MKQKKLLFVILMVGFLLRILFLNSYPTGFTPDEASFGYDAYSLLKTGKDQWGHAFPLVLESFGDFKPPLYAYLLIPFVGVFGLERWVIRLPNALLGVAAIYVVYLLARELRRKSNKNLEVGRWKLEILAAALLSISPWHIMMSRGGFEANLTTFFLPLGIYLFLKGLRKKKYLIWASVVFGLNMFSYHSARLITPIILGALVIMYRRQIDFIKSKVQIISGAIFALFLALSLYTLFQGAGTRVQDISIYSGSLQAAAEERIDAINSGLNPTIARLLHNKFQVTGKRFLSNYLRYFSPDFLFINGPAETTYGMIPGKGVLYWFELPFLIGSLVYFAKRKLTKTHFLLLVWIIIAPVAAALTTGPGFAGNRSVIMLPALQIFLSVGALELFNWSKQKIPRTYFRVVFLAYFAATLVFVASFIETYFVLSPLKAARGMLSGNLEAVSWVLNNYPNTQVIVSRNLSEPHIYFAFAGEVDPTEYQEQTKKWDYKTLGVSWVDQIPSYNLNSITFENIDWSKHASMNSVLVGKPDEFPEKIGAVKVLTYPDGEEAIIIVDNTDNAYAGNIN